MPYLFINANYIPEAKCSIIELVSINQSTMGLISTDQETM
jgi:hypothetical protein